MTIPAFWRDLDARPKVAGPWIFLPEAVERIGAALFGDNWGVANFLTDWKPGTLSPADGYYGRFGQVRNSKPPHLYASRPNATLPGWGVAQVKSKIAPNSSFYIHLPPAEWLRQQEWERGRENYETARTIAGWICDRGRDGRVATALLSLVGGHLKPVAAEIWNNTRDLDRVRAAMAWSHGKGCYVFLNSNDLDRALAMVGRSEVGLPEELPAPGRPKLVHRIRPELERRIEAREAYADTSKEARYLAGWYAEAFPGSEGNQPLSNGAIRSDIAARMREYRAAGNALKAAENPAGNTPGTC